MKRITSVVLALAVHALTLAFIVLGGWVITVNHDFLPAWLLGGLLLAIGVALRPRMGRVPADAEVLSRSSAPELYGTAERVADAVGTRRPGAVAIADLMVGADNKRVGLRRTPVLIIGLPVWLALTPRQRVALLAKAYAGADGDAGFLVEGALSTLAEWRHSLLGSEPLRRREEAHTEMAASLGVMGAPDTSYEVAGFLGRVLGRVLGWPVLLVEYALTRLARSGEAERALARLELAGRVAPADELNELDELMSSGRYLAPMQAAALRGESVVAIREGALARSKLSEGGLLGTAESDRIDVELHAHYARAVRGFGLIS